MPLLEQSLLPKWPRLSRATSPLPLRPLLRPHLVISPSSSPADLTFSRRLSPRLPVWAEGLSRSPQRLCARILVAQSLGQRVIIIHFSAHLSH